MRSIAFLTTVVTIMAITSISIENSWAQTKYLLMNGGVKDVENYENIHLDFVKLDRAFTDIGLTNGTDYEILTYNGKWSLATLQSTGYHAKRVVVEEAFSPALSGSILSPQALQKRFSTMTWEGTKSIVLYFGGHGRCAKEQGVAESTSWGMGDDYFKWQEIKTSLEAIPPTVSVKIITTACYGGGAHYLSRTMKNVCSVASVPFNTPSCCNTKASHEFINGLAEELSYSKGKSSLAMLGIAGMNSDWLNAEHGSLSSFDYINYVLKKAPYDRKREPHYLRILNYRDYYENGADKLSEQLLPNDYKTFSTHDETSFADALLSSPFDSYTKDRHGDNDTCDAPLPSAITDEMTKILDSLEATDETPGWVDYFKSFFVEPQPQIKQTHPYRYFYQNLSKREPLPSDYSHLEQRLLTNKSQGLFLEKIRARISDLKEFSQVASASEKKKFLELLKCEGENL
ncbi:MAG: hypothetical protein HQK52_04685 [Oligoflexia bacterium]|nr:hypothetical protein [Oligoflexia bacterium]